MGMPSPPHPQGAVLPTRAFLVTISTKGDVEHECVQKLVAHWSKCTAHAFVVSEFGENGKLHLHAVLLYKENRLRCKLHENLWTRFVKPFHPDSIGEYAVVVQVCPGNKWYDDYLRKESDSTVLFDSYDREAAEAYFPSQAVQEALMEHGNRKGMAAPHVDKRVAAWAASAFENSPAGALTYLQHCMYVEKTMVPLDDLRRLTSKSVMYWKYRNGHTAPTERELFMLKQLVDGPEYDVPRSFPRAQPFVAAPPGI